LAWLVCSCFEGAIVNPLPQGARLIAVNRPRRRNLESAWKLQFCLEKGVGMARRLVDRDSILEWAATRRASPARVATPVRDESDPGLRLQFEGNGRGSDEVLVPISWDEWFTTFEAYRLALVVDDRDPAWREAQAAGRGPH
jgi:hypothetical protein